MPKIECSSIGSSLFIMNLALSNVKCTGLTGNFSLTLSIFYIVRTEIIYLMINLSHKPHLQLCWFHICNFKAFRNVKIYVRTGNQIQKIF